ncbi:MAG: putative ATP-dependent RNA helicase DHR1 [Alyxoria varia]|nr:MAG: putative ATP-dependent RNA helicase DHR1 [Alyxoria varia]
MPTPIPRRRKQKQLKPSNGISYGGDTNDLEISPASISEKNERKQKLQRELLVQQESRSVSSKKRKRLDKYIDNKLKKESNLDLIRKLSEQKVDTSLFRSSKKLGQGKDSQREVLARALKEQKAGLNGSANAELLYTPRPQKNDDVESEPDDIPESSTNVEPLLSVSDENQTKDNVASAPYTFGAGLKRPLETDEQGNPIIKKKAKKIHHATIVSRPVVDVSDFEGFSSGSEKGSDEENDLQDETRAPDQSSASPSADEGDDSDDSLSSENDFEDTSTSSEEDSAVDMERMSAFKAWASQQRNEAVGFTPSRPMLEEPPPTKNSSAILPGSIASEGQHLQDKATDSIDLSNLQTEPTVFNVKIDRAPEVNAARIELPVVAEEQKIMETIQGRDCTVICGATGSGKTTQVPQFMFEAGYGHADAPTPGMIGVTQPRRVAAVSMAKRVALELGDHGNKVSHQVRFNSSVGNNTAIKFMTDGVLLREVSQDFTLSKYSVIIIDEAHERSVNTDILIGMLSRIVDTRKQLSTKSTKHKPLKLVIMSATLRLTDFLLNRSLFRSGSPPVVQAEGRQHPVTVHFARKTQRDYVDETYNRLCKAHRKLPPGGMLVFLTGKDEITRVMRRLKDTFSSTQDDSQHPKMRLSAAEASIEDEDLDIHVHEKPQEQDVSDSDSDISVHGVDNVQTKHDEGHEFDIEEDSVHELLKIHILPLYSQLPTEQQMRVFETPPEGSRLIVVATNVAETSLTIPGIRYVFDCGRSKEKRYDAVTGVQSFVVSWISKASASQRAGRAGRTEPGHCYRVYSSAVYENHFEEHALPEIHRTSVESVVLQLKAMGIPNIANFPFPTPPDRQALVKAERLLENLGALADGKVTPAGKELSTYPLSPRLARILESAHRKGCLDHAFALVSTLAVPDVFASEAQLGLKDPEPSQLGELWTSVDVQAATTREKRRKEYNSFHGHLSRLDRHSDAVKLLSTFIEFSKTQLDQTEAIQHFTHTKSLQEAAQLNQQLTQLIRQQHLDQATYPPTSLSAPSSAQIKLLRQLVAAGYIDQIAQRADLSPTPPVSARVPTRSIDVPYVTLFASSVPGRDRSNTDQDRTNYVYIHSSSVLAHVSPNSLPQFLIYSHLSRAPASTITAPQISEASVSQPKSPRIRMHPLTPITTPQIIALAKDTPLLGEGKPVGKIEALDRDVGTGEERRGCWCVPLLRGAESHGGVREWPLPPARRVVQRRIRGRGWVVEGDGGNGEK